MIALWGCQPETEAEEQDTVLENGLDEHNNINVKTGCIQIDGSETVKIGGVSIDIKEAEGEYFGDLLVLPAWDDDRDAWCLRSRLCTKARRKGYRVIMPDMDKSIYANMHYPEMREDWRTQKTFPWLRDTLISILQNDYCMLKEEGNNFVIGVSAGARGAVKLLQESPELFSGAAALSGDYNPSMLAGDNVYRGFLGDIEKYGRRWDEAENLCFNTQTMKTPLYLSHGKDDSFMPSSQSQALFEAIKDQNPDLRCHFVLAEGEGHGYNFWNAEISQVLNFFESLQAYGPESPN